MHGCQRVRSGVSYNRYLHNLRLIITACADLAYSRSKLQTGTTPSSGLDPTKEPSDSSCYAAGVAPTIPDPNADTLGSGDTPAFIGAASEHTLDYQPLVDTIDFTQAAEQFNNSNDPGVRSKIISDCYTRAWQAYSLNVENYKKQFQLKHLCAMDEEELQLHADYTSLCIIKELGYTHKMARKGQEELPTAVTDTLSPQTQDFAKGYWRDLVTDHGSLKG
jgi:hypothetical protein